MALVVGLATVFSMTKIWSEAFWKPRPEGGRPGTGRLLPMAAPVVLLALVTLMIGLVPQPLLEYAAQAARELLDPSIYARGVLGALP